MKKNQVRREEEEKVKKDAARPGWKWIRDLDHKISRREKILAGKLGRLDAIAAEQDKLATEQSSLHADVQHRTDELHELRSQLAARQVGPSEVPHQIWTAGIPSHVLQHQSLVHTLHQVETAIGQVRAAAAQIERMDVPAMAPAPPSAGTLHPPGSMPAAPEPAPSSAGTQQPSGSVPVAGRVPASSGLRERRSGRRGTSPHRSSRSDDDSSVVSDSGRSRSRERRDSEADALQTAALGSRSLLEMGFDARVCADPYGGADGGGDGVRGGAVPATSSEHCG